MYILLVIVFSFNSNHRKKNIMYRTWHKKLSRQMYIDIYVCVYIISIGSVTGKKIMYRISVNNALYRITITNYDNLEFLLAMTLHFVIHDI